MKSIHASLALVGTALALAGCSADQMASAPNSATPLAGVVCPPAGTVAVRDNGTRIRYGGSDPTDPAVCLVSTPDGGTSRALGGLLATHPVNEATRRQALASLFPLATGRSSRARYRLVSAANPLYQTPFEESFRVTGERPFRMEGGETRQAWVVEGVLRSLMDGSTVYDSVYSIDKATGVVLSQATTSSTGATSGARPFRVTDLAVPAR